MNYKLNSKYNYNNYLKQIEDNVYNLETDAHYIELIDSEDKSYIMAVDPPGGPLMMVGEFCFNDKILKEIIQIEDTITLKF